MVLDIIILVILLLSAFIGYKKGLIGIAVSLIALLLSLVLAIFLQKTVANYLYKETTIGTTIEESIKKSIEIELKDKKDEVVNDDKNRFLEMFLDINSLTNSMVDDSANKLTMFILKGVSFVGIFLIVFIICYILRMVLNIVFKLPILDSVNKIGGISLNTLKAVFKIWILLAIIYFISFMPMIENLNNIIDSSILTKFLYENNLIVNILKSTLGL